MAITTNDVWPVAPNFDDTPEGSQFVVKEFSDIDVKTADVSTLSAINNPRLCYYDTTAEKMKLCPKTGKKPTYIYLPGSCSGTVASFIPLGAKAYQVASTDDLGIGETVYTDDDGMITNSGGSGQFAVGFSRSATPATIGEVQGALVLFQPYQPQPYSA